MDNKWKEDYIKIPLLYTETEDGKKIIINIENEFHDKYLGHSAGIVCSGNNLEQAKERVLAMMAANVSFSDEIWDRYQKWALLDWGPWTRGGKWFRILGITFNFRYGKNMKGGFYIPFSKLNISISNAWI